jgi:hypothetical protein
MLPMLKIGEDPETHRLPASPLTTLPPTLPPTLPSVHLPCHCRGFRVALDVASAVEYLHTDLQLLHSDLKSR